VGVYVEGDARQDVALTVEGVDVLEREHAVTVMNEGTVLVDGTVEDARTSPKVQEVYIGSATISWACTSKVTPDRMWLLP
jgi:formylmethanofuran dehydrogenase subunit C